MSFVAGHRDWNDTNPSMVLRAHESQDAAAKLGVRIQSIGVHDLISFEYGYVLRRREPSLELTRSR